MKLTTGLKFGLAAAVLMAPVSAFALNQSVTANIAFDTPLSMVKNNDINFGTVSAGVADTYTITTAGVATAAATGQLLYGTPAAGDIAISGSTTQTINISVGSYTANNGVTPANATCDYNGAGSGTCALTGVAAPGAGKTLLIGVDAVVSGAQAAGSSAAPTFTVSVVYN